MPICKNLPTRPLGRNGPLVPRLGLGLMGLSGQYGYSASESARLRFLDESYVRGQFFWDTGQY